MSLTFFDKHKTIIASRIAAGEKIASPTVTPEGVDKAHAATLVDFCHAILNSNEFVYRN